MNQTDYEAARDNGRLEETLRDFFKYDIGGTFPETGIEEALEYAGVSPEDAPEFEDIAIDLAEKYGYEL